MEWGCFYQKVPQIRFLESFSRLAYFHGPMKDEKWWWKWILKKKRYTYLNVCHCFSQFIKSLLRQSQKSRIDNELIPRSRKMANNSSENPGGNIISFAWSKLQFIMDMTNGFSVQCTKVPPRCAHSSSSIWLVFQKPVLYFIFSVAEFFSLSSFKI